MCLRNCPRHPSQRGDARRCWATHLHRKARRDVALVAGELRGVDAGSRLDDLSRKKFVSQPAPRDTIWPPPSPPLEVLSRKLSTACLMACTLAK